MTDAGRDFYQHAVDMLQQAAEAENVVRQRLAEPAGTVRFTSATATSQFAMRDMLANFMATYPKVNLVQHVSDDFVDIVGDDFDVAIRSHSGPLTDSSLVQKHLAAVPWILVVGARYRPGHRLPEAPEELSQHDSLFMTRTKVATSWTFRPHDNSALQQTTVQLRPRFQSDDMVALKRAAIAGAGIVALPAYVCREELASRELLRILPDWTVNESTMTALFRDGRGLLPAVRVFIDWLAREFPKVTRL